MADRLEEIKAVDPKMLFVAEVDWLITEVERLRKQGDALREVFDQNNAYYAEILALRAAVDELAESVRNQADGENDDFVNKIYERLARAVAVAVLTGQEPT